MRFFEDFDEVKNEMSIGITNLLSNITTRPGSHKGGWARLLKCQLHNLGAEIVDILDSKSKLSDYDIIIFDLGAEYSGALNLFGGLDEKVYKRLNELKEFEGLLFCWRNELPDVRVLNSRRHNTSTCEQFKSAESTFLDSVDHNLSFTRVFEHVYRTENILIGDSHTPSVWTPYYMIERRDGRTLKGMLEHKTLERIINTHFLFSGHSLNRIQVHCSSIDIRHHACREPSPTNYVTALAADLVHQMKQFSDQTLVITQTMGIEDESRELPKTGYFKGTPFFGSWDQRNLVRQVFNDRIEEGFLLDDNVEILKFPEYFFDETGKLKFEVMEVPGSVHLSPEHYRWNLDNNTKRW